METADQIASLRAAAGRPGGPSSDFDLNPDIRLPDARRLRPAGVLVAFVPGDGGLSLILTKRSPRLRHHPGQIALPGGKQEDADPDVTAAALREAREEVALDPAVVDVLGCLPPHETVTGFKVTPVIALVTGPFLPVPEPGEVDEIFSVPFRHVSDLGQFQVQSRRWRGTRRRYYCVPWGPYYIWGATARILHGLAQRLAP